MGSRPADRKVEKIKTVNIPQELKKRQQWVCYKLMPTDEGKTTKIPINPKTGGNASHADSKTWASFQVALNTCQGSKGKFDGIGFVCTEKDPYCGIDLDDCVDPQTGGIKPEVMAIVRMFNSYTEKTPSGKGLRIWFKGKLPEGGRRDQGEGIEVYDRLRYFTVTGWHLPDTPKTINSRQKELDTFLEQYFPKEEKDAPPPAPAAPVNLDDQELLEKARASKNGTKFEALFRGDWKGAGYPSQSEADLALCNHLAFWTGRDAGRMDSLFRQSGLFRRKWYTKHFADGRTYGQAVIEQAVKNTTEVYEHNQGNSVDSIYSVPKEETWESPTPLQGGELPPFPTEIFPTWLKEYVEGLAKSTQTPPDLAGMGTLSGVATALQKKFIVVVRPGWVEPVNIYTEVVLPPGERKTAVYEEIIEPLEEYEVEITEKLSPEIAEEKSKKKILEEKLKVAQQQAAKADDPEEAGRAEARATELAKELCGFEVPPPPRLLADDATPEAAATLLAEQGGKIAIISAETSLFEVLAGRYSQNTGVNLEVFLKGHAGDSLRVDRKGRPTEYVKGPAITIGIAIQPDILNGLAAKPGFRGRGLLARFLYSIPPSMVGKRNTKPPSLAPKTKENYTKAIKKLLELQPGTDENGKAAPHVLRLSPETEALSDEFAAWLEPQMAPHGSLDFIADWAAKLHGAVARVAGLLHVAENYSNPSVWNIPISTETFKAAIRFGKYLIPHAKAAFGEMGSDGRINDAKYVLRWIEKNDKKPFTKRDAHNAMQGRFKRVEDLEPALKILHECGYIRELQADDRKGPGRKPSPVFEVNPLSTQYIECTETPNKDNSVDSVDSVPKDSISEHEPNSWEEDIDCK